MPRKKVRSFVNKKSATQFTMVRRSQRDPLFHDATATKYVMQPVGGGTTAEYIANEAVLATEAQKSRTDGASGKLHREVDEMGFRIDGYDYSQHMAVMGDGTFVGTDGTARSGSAHAALTAKQTSHPDEIMEAPAELDRDFEAITLDAAGMDPEIWRALEGEGGGGDGGAMEEILDDFVVTATTVTAEAAAAEAAAAASSFDFDAHVKRLLAEAEREDNMAASRAVKNEHSDSGDEYFATDSDDDLVIEDVTSGGAGGGSSSTASTARPAALSAAAASEQQRFVNERFELMMAQGEYDDDALGALPAEGSDSDDDGIVDKHAGTAISLESATLDSLLNEFLEENPKAIGNVPKPLRQKQLNLKKGGGASAEGDERFAAMSLMGRASTSVRTSGCNDDDAGGDLKEIIVQLHNARVAKGEAEDEPDEAEVNKEIDDDVASYFGLETRVKSKWDCESVLSTYSTTDNLPTVIGRKSRRKKKKQRAQIGINPRTGLPFVMVDEEEEGEGEEEEEGGNSLIYTANMNTNTCWVEIAIKAC